MSTLQDRMNAALEYRRSTARNPADISQANLAKYCGIKPPSVNDWFSGKTLTMKAETALLAAEYLHVRTEWLAYNRGPMLGAKDNPAQQPNKDGYRLLPPLYSWEEMMAAELPEEFRLVIGESALAPLVPEGTVAFFDRLKKVRPGEGILVEDGDGVRHLRRYRPISGNDWEAYAMHDGYRTLQTILDSKLKIIAVYDGQRGSLVGK